MGYSKKFENTSHSRSILAKEQPTTFTMQSIIILALVGLLTVTATSGQSLMPPSPFEATECGNMGYNSMQIGPNCYFWVNGSFTMEQAREQCVNMGGILATLHEKNRVLTCCDGTQKDEHDASMKGMWYPGQPCWTRDTPNMVVAYRSQTVILDKPEMERFQGLYTIKTSTMWNALCMTNK